MDSIPTTGCCQIRFHRSSGLNSRPNSQLTQSRIEASFVESRLIDFGKLAFNWQCKLIKIKRPVAKDMTIEYYDRWRHHLSPPPQFRRGTEVEGTFLQFPALVIQPTRLRPTDLTSTYSVYTRRVFGGTGIELRPSGLESGALTTRLPTALPKH
ncbi:hypothetical protein TNCV_4910931 [Trichonephila clavipes]|nr:hypothetical protein TNCV_4910931 [Trichonephila clavipes]